MYYVYALKCANNDWYIGSCENIKIRISQHTDGHVKSTKAKRPVKLVYYEAYLEKSDALKREKLLKQHRPKSDLKIQIGF